MKDKKNRFCVKARRRFLSDMRKNGRTEILDKGKGKEVMRIKDYLKKRCLLADGAFGTYYMQIEGKNRVVELANINNPKIVERIHLDYLKAGSRLIRTNTFSANLAVLGGERDWRKGVIQAGYRCAENAVKDFCGMCGERAEEVFVAASIGPIPDSLAEEEQEILEEYYFICDSFLECRAKIFCFETGTDFKYILPAAAYIRERAGEDAFIMANFCLNRYGYTKSGIYAGRLLEQADDYTEVDAVGFNCGIGTGHMLHILKEIQLCSNKFLAVMPNSGYPERIQDRTVYLNNAQYFAETMGKMAELGISVFGGCCGTSPEYIRLTREQIVLDCPAKKIEIQKKAVFKNQINYSKNEFCQKLKEGKKVIAVELDPPYDANIQGILDRANRLKAAGIDFITFADSPMARPRMDSVLTGVKVQNEVGISVMPHISCRDKNTIALRAQLLGAYVNGIRNLLIVTGDPIAESERGTIHSVFDFYSVRLMEFVQEMNREHFLEEPLCYGGAISYARANLEVEMERVRKKKAAGAQYFLTQPVFSKEDAERIQVIKSQTDVKILCGIMPLISLKNAKFIANELSGIRVPQSVVAEFSPDMSREEGEIVGVRIAKRVMQWLEETADGYYFIIPFNRVYLVEKCLMPDSE